MMRADVSWVITELYLVSWITFGNYILVNLFISILLDSFAAIEEEDHDTA